LFILKVRRKKEKKKTSDSTQKLNKRTYSGATTVFEKRKI